MGSGRASSTLVLPSPIVTARETTPGGLRAAVGDHIPEGQGDWGQAWQAGNAILDPDIVGDARDHTLAEALEPWVQPDGWGADPGSAAFWDSPDPDMSIGSEDTGTSRAPAAQWDDHVDALRERLLEDMGQGADYFDVVAAAERLTQDEALISDVLSYWDSQPSSTIPHRRSVHFPRRGFRLWRILRPPDRTVTPRNNRSIPRTQDA